MGDATFDELRTIHDEAPGASELSAAADGPLLHHFVNPAAIARRH